MRKSQADQRAARKQQTKGQPRRNPVSRNGRPFMNSIKSETNLRLWAGIYGGHPLLATPDFSQFQSTVSRGDKTPSRSRFPPPHKHRRPALPCGKAGLLISAEAYFEIEATTPEPTVRPPSRIAKRRPSSIAIGAISLTLIVTLSPGITISVPSGRITSPVTSVVRK